MLLLIEPINQIVSQKETSVKYILHNFNIHGQINITITHQHEVCIKIVHNIIVKCSIYAFDNTSDLIDLDNL